MNLIQAVNFCVLGNLANEQPGIFDESLTNKQVLCFQDA